MTIRPDLTFGKVQVHAVQVADIAGTLEYLYCHSRGNGVVAEVVAGLAGLAYSVLILAVVTATVNGLYHKLVSAAVHVGVIFGVLTVPVSIEVVVAGNPVAIVVPAGIVFPDVPAVLGGVLPSVPAVVPASGAAGLAPCTVSHKVVEVLVVTGAIMGVGVVFALFLIAVGQLAELGINIYIGSGGIYIVGVEGVHTDLTAGQIAENLHLVVVRVGLEEHAVYIVLFPSIRFFFNLIVINRNQVYCTCTVVYVDTINGEVTEVTVVETVSGENQETVALELESATAGGVEVVHTEVYFLQVVNSNLLFPCVTGCGSLSPRHVFQPVMAHVVEGFDVGVLVLVELEEYILTLITGHGDYVALVAGHTALCVPSGDVYTVITITRAAGGAGVIVVDDTLATYVDNEVGGVSTSLGLRIDGLSNQLTLYAYKLDNNYYTSAQIDVKIDSISQGVVDVNGRVDGLGDDIDDLSGLVSSLNSKYNSLSNNMGALEDYMEGAFADGLIDQSEREAIRTYLNTVDNDYLALAADYDELYNNQYLALSENSAKRTALQTAFTNLNSAYTSLISKINTVVAQTTVSSSDKSAINSLFDTYTSKVKLFHTAVKAAEAAIEKSIYELAIKEAKEFTQTVFTPTKYSDSANPWGDWEGGTEWQHIGDLWTPSSGGEEYYYPAGTRCTAVAGETYRYIGGVPSSTGVLPNVWEPTSLVAKSATYIFQNGQRISSIAGNFDADGKILEASGILTTATGTTIWNQVGDKLVASINATANTVAITAAHIKLNGYVSNTNGSFSVSETGYVTMKDCDVEGKITATSGTIGGFVIGSSSIYTNDNAYSGGSGVNSFSSSKFFLHASGSSSAFLGFSATSKWAGIGLNTMPATTDWAALARFEDTVVNSTECTKIGIYLNVAGAGTYDNVGKGNCAIYAEQGVYAGFRIGTRLTTSSITLTKMDNLVICYNTVDITVTLPTGCEKGQVIMVRPAGTKGVTVATTSGYILRDSDASTGGVTSNLCGGKWLHFFFYDKYNNRWLMSYSN